MNNSKKTILITGSAGFVGAHLVEHILINTDWDVVGIDSFNHRGDSMRVYHDSKRYRIFLHDLRAPLSEVLIKEIGYVNYIINMASESHVDRSISDPLPFIQNNVSVALNMLEYARIIKPEKFIQISTDEVYGPAIEGYNHKEWEIHLPSNPYSASKSCQESICISYWRTYGVPIIITNTMNMIGERQDKEKFLPMIISKISKGEIVTIHGDKEYIGSRFYLHARNHADALLFLLKNNKPTAYNDSMTKVYKPDKFNIVGDIEINNLDFAKLVAKIMNKELKYELQDFHHTRPGHDRRYALCGNKIKEMGWMAPISFEESVERTVKWTLYNPQWML